MKRTNKKYDHIIIFFYYFNGKINKYFIITRKNFLTTNLVHFAIVHFSIWRIFVCGLFLKLNK